MKVKDEAVEGEPNQVGLGDRFIRLAWPESGEWEAESWEGLGVLLLRNLQKRRRSVLRREENVLDPLQWQRMPLPTSPP